MASLVPDGGTRIVKKEKKVGLQIPPLQSVMDNNDSVMGLARNVHVTFDPHVNCGSDGKHEQEEDEDEGLQIVCRDSLHTKQDGPEQFTLKT